ncbi:MAG: SRPBCC family protein [Hyphomicrobiaceae bacterium]|nr:SRPBCC family protein [Hyphomicrobiaceae bacterium]
MRSGTSQFSSLTFLLAASVFPGTAEAQLAFDPGQLLQLKQGDVIVSVRPDPEGAAGLVDAAIEIPVAPKDLWAKMLDCEASRRFLASLKACRVLSASANNNSDVREHVVQWIWPLPEVRSVFRSEYKPFEKITFERVDGDLKFLKGTWQLEPLGNGSRTRLTYRARVTPGWAVPDTLVRLAIETDIPKTLKALRAEATRRDP